MSSLNKSSDVYIIHIARKHHSDSTKLHLKRLMLVKYMLKLSRVYLSLQVIIHTCSWLSARLLLWERFERVSFAVCCVWMRGQTRSKRYSHTHALIKLLKMWALEQACLSRLLRKRFCRVTFASIDWVFKCVFTCSSLHSHCSHEQSLKFSLRFLQEMFSVLRFSGAVISWRTRK